jgi:hypothetical protein
MERRPHHCGLSWTKSILRLAQNVNLVRHHFNASLTSVNAHFFIVVHGLSGCRDFSSLPAAKNAATTGISGGRFRGRFINQRSSISRSPLADKFAPKNGDAQDVMQTYDSPGEVGPSSNRHKRRLEKGPKSQGATTRENQTNISSKQATTNA